VHVVALAAEDLLAALGEQLLVVDDENGDRRERIGWRQHRDGHPRFGGPERDRGIAGL
jgi:hypothetical protein